MASQRNVSTTCTPREVLFLRDPTTDSFCATRRKLPFAKVSQEEQHARFHVAAYGSDDTRITSSGRLQSPAFSRARVVSQFPKRVVLEISLKARGKAQRPLIEGAVEFWDSVRRNGDVHEE